jgi:hypothetical protein
MDEKDQEPADLEKQLDKEETIIQSIERGPQQRQEGRVVRHLPAVLHSFPTLRRGKQQLRVRIVQYPRSEPLLDIREFITGETFNGFSKKGITINLEQATSLFENVELIMKALSGND